MRRSIVLARVALAALVGVASSVLAQAPLTNPNLSLEVAGQVQAMDRLPDGRVLIGGYFTSVNGIPRTHLAILNSNGTLDATFAPVLDEGVSGLFVAGTHVFVYGGFTTVGGVARNSLARIALADGSLDPAWDAALVGSISAFAPDGAGGILVAGANISSVGGLTGRKIARLSGTTGAGDAGWNPALPPNLSRVTAIGANGGFAYVALTEEDPVSFIRNGRLVRFAGDTGALDATFAPSINLINADDSVARLAWDGAGNTFMTSFQMPVAKFVASTGQSDPAWVMPPDAGFVFVDGAAVYTMSAVPTGPRLSSPRFLNKRSATTGAIDATWVPVSLGTRDALAMAWTPEGLWVGGWFRAAGNAFAPGLFRANATTGAVDTAFPASLRFPTIEAGWGAALLPDGKYLVGGLFDWVNGVQRSNLARLNSDGTLDDTWATQTDEWVGEVHVVGSHAYVGGQFFRIGGQPLKGVARVNAATGVVDTAWTPNPDDFVRRIATDGTDIFLYGNFESVGGGARSSIAKVAGTTGTLVTAFDTGLGTGCGTNKAPVVYHAGFVYLGVRLCQNVLGAYNVRRYNATTGGMDAAWLPNPNGTVRDILIEGDSAYLFGQFSTVNGTSRPRMAKVNLTNGALDTAWGGGTSGLSYVTRAAIVGSNLFVGGPLNSGGGRVERYALADGIRSPGWSAVLADERWGFVAGSFVYGFAASPDGQKILVAGGFSKIGSEPRANFAAFATGEDVTPDAFALGSAPSVPAGSQVTSPAVTISGLTGQATVSVTGGSYSVGCNGTFVTSVGYISNGQVICVRHASSATAGGQVTTTLTIGGVVATFTSTTHGSRGDVNGDGKADLFWRTAAPGTGLSWWTMNGAVATAANYHDVDPAWQIADVGDLDGDGKADLVWRRASDGATYLWLLDGFAFKGFADLGVLDPAAWSLVGTGDLNGDGKDDVVWRGVDGTVYAWLMNGGVIASQGVISNPGAQWLIADLADMDGDGKADIVFRNSVDGGIYIYFMNGLAIASGGYVGAVDPAAWTLVGAADFSGDGKADFLWRHTSGDTWIWLMNGASFLSAGGIGNPGTDWSVRALADVDGNARTDLVWRHTDGTTYLWKLNGPIVLEYLPVANPGGTWQVVAP